MNWRLAIKRSIPAPVLNRLLLGMPFLYGTPIVRYESGLQERGGLEDLLSQLEATFPLPGDVIECGSSRCGTSVILALRLRAAGIRKRVHACDSFEGFDRGELGRERARGLTTASESDFTSTSWDYVRAKLRRLGLEGDVIPVRGYFRDTLPALAGPFSFALIDCDLMESMTVCAETLWPRLVPGGRIVFDDYVCDDFRGATRAVDGFVDRHRAEIGDHGLLNRLYLVTKPGGPSQPDSVASPRGRGV